MSKKWDTISRTHLLRIYSSIKIYLRLYSLFLSRLRVPLSKKSRPIEGRVLPRDNRRPRVAHDEQPVYNGFARDQRRPWQWLTTTRSDDRAGVATQTPCARAVRSMHPEVVLARRPGTRRERQPWPYTTAPMANKVHPLLNGWRSTVPRPGVRREGETGEKNGGSEIQPLARSPSRTR